MLSPAPRTRVIGCHPHRQQRSKRMQALDKERGVNRDLRHVPPVNGERDSLGPGRIQISPPPSAEMRSALCAQLEIHLNETTTAGRAAVAAVHLSLSADLWKGGCKSAPLDCSGYA